MYTPPMNSAFATSVLLPALAKQKCSSAPLCMSAKPKKRSAAKRLKRVRKSQARLMEYVPFSGDFPTMAEIDAEIASLEVKAASEEQEKMRLKKAKVKQEKNLMKNTETGVSVCGGKACMRKGGESFLQEALVVGEKCGVVVEEGRCMGDCKSPGVTVRLGMQTVSISDVDALEGALGDFSKRM